MSYWCNCCARQYSMSCKECCEFLPLSCEACDYFSEEELKCLKLGYCVASNSGEPCWSWNMERHEDCPLSL